MPSAPAVEMKNISFRYGTKTILNGFDLTIEKGKTYCLVGSSGSGKTTTLRLINGLLRPSSGQIKIDGKDFDFSQAEKWRRSMGYSIQGSGLFPHMTVYENLSIIARKEGMSDQQIQSRISELCELVNLPADSTFLNKRPRQISGGQQQRVGIARALFMEPDVMLMDEPFSALDPITRSELQKEFVSLKQKLDMTVILVTHDLPEAFQMADEIVLLNSGRIEQKGRPSQFLLKPTSNFVKEFIRSHSPGNLLKQVYLYSVVNNQLFTAIRKSNSITLTNLDNGQSFNFLNVDEVYSYLQKFDQTAIYWTDEMGQFLHFEHQRSEPCFDHLISTDHILNGMKKILDSGLTTLPVVSERGQLIGVFSREALDAL